MNNHPNRLKMLTIVVMEASHFLDVKETIWSAATTVATCKNEV